MIIRSMSIVNTDVGVCACGRDKDWELNEKKKTSVVGTLSSDNVMDLSVYNTNCSAEM